MLRRTFLLLALVLSLPLVAQAAPTMIAGTHVLQPETAGQTFQILATGEPGDQFAGIDLYLYVADGNSGPLLTEVDVVGPGTLFFGNANPQIDFGPPFTAPGREVVAITTTLSGFVGPNGVVANVTVDTTGVAPGDYILSLSTPNFGGSDLPPFGFPATNLVDGILRVVPEPSSVVLGIFAAAGLGATLMRRRARRAA
jgi:hypothetical protein